MKNNLIFIVNSRIGEAKISELKQAIHFHFPAIDFKIELTQYGGHAIELAKEAVQKNTPIIVAVGGDGTINEVVQSMAKSESTLAIIPTGSGNGLARHCDIPLKIHDAVGLIQSGRKIKIDLGMVNHKYFISNAGVGFDAWVCNQIKETKSRGLKMYAMQVFKNYFSYKSASYKIIADEKEINSEAFFLNVANGKEFGYGFQIAPEANLQDGMLDMILVKRINIWTGFGFVWDGWRKKLTENKNCIYLRAKRIMITSQQLNYFQTDGDAHSCREQCLIDVHENALNILVGVSIQKL